MSLADANAATPRVGYDVFFNFKSFKNVLALIGATATAAQAAYSGYGWVLARMYADPHLLRTFDRVALLVQTAIIAGLVFVRPDQPVPKMLTHELADAVKASKQFLNLWIIAWVAWLALYVILSLSEFQIIGDSVSLHVAIDACNLANACCLFLCFQTMVERSTGAFEEKYHTAVIRYTVACALIILAEFVAVSVAAQMMSQAASQHVQLYFQCGNGIVSAIAISLLVGRLESLWIKSSLFLIVILYTYASIQILFPWLQIFGQVSGGPSPQFLSPRGEEYRSVLATAALIGKMALFAEIGRITTAGVLTYYMYEYRRSFDRHNERSAFLNKYFAG